MKNARIAAILLLIHLTCSLSAQTSPTQPARFPSSFYLFAGSDLEATPRRKINFIPALNYGNVGMGYRMNLHADWMLGTELWLSSFATPRIERIQIRHLDPDGERITLTDTIALLRMRGATLAVSGIRALPAGFSLHLGVQAGYYPLAMTEYGRSAVSAISDNRAYQAGWSYDYQPTPDWVRRWQAALRIGVEKRFFRNFILGLSVQQGLNDLSIPGNTRNLPTNWLGYLAYRVDLVTR